MSTVTALLTLGHALKQAASEHDWQEVERTDRKLADALSALQDHPREPELLGALNEVHHLHKQVMHYCQTQSDILAEKMALSRRNREGATAYALFMDDGEMR